MGRKIHYAWIVMIGCCVWMAALPGIVLSCVGVFYRSISTELNVGLEAVSLYTTCSTLSRMAALPIFGKIMPKVNLKFFLVFVAGLMCGGFSLCSTVTSVVQLYIFACIVGVGSGAALYMVVPSLLNSWFKDRIGAVMGFAMAFSGIGGALFNPVASRLLTEMGWRAAMRTLALIAFVAALAASLILIKDSPARIGLLPYEDKKKKSGNANVRTDTEADGMSAKDAWRTKAFAFILVYVIAVAYATSIQSHIANFAVDSGVSVQNSGFAASACSIGSIIGSPVLGMLNDKLGMKKAAVLFGTIGIAGGLMCAGSGWNISLVYPGVLLLGMFYACLALRFRY